MLESAYIHTNMHTDASMIIELKEMSMMNLKNFYLKIFLLFCLISMAGCGSKQKSATEEQKNKPVPSALSASSAESVEIPPATIDCRRQKGSVKYWREIEWVDLRQNDILKPAGGIKLKTMSDGFAAIITAVNGDFIMFPNTEIFVSPPTIDPVGSNKAVISGTIFNGEINVNVNQSSMLWKVEEYGITGHGILKIKFNQTSGDGELIVSTGEFSVIYSGQTQQAAKISGGQMITIKNRKFEKTKPAGVETYDWQVDALYK